MKLKNRAAHCVSEIAIKIFRTLRDGRARRRDNRLTRISEKSYELLWRDEKNPLKKICYFSSYDCDGVVDESVFHYLSELERLDFGIVFITTSSTISDGDLDRLKSMTKAVIHRANLGYDFYSWKVGMTAYPASPDTHCVLLVNDSVYGPLFPLEQILKHMDVAQRDMVGITDSWEPSYHIQSYFMYCKNEIIRSGFLHRFFQNVKVVSKRRDIIRLYELGFSQRLSAEGFKIGALVDYRELYSKYFAPTMDRPEFKNDPSIFFWKELVTNFLSPFIKRKIFKVWDSNADLILQAIKRVIEKNNSKLKFQVILDHYKRLSRRLDLARPAH